VLFGLKAKESVPPLRACIYKDNKIPDLTRLAELNLQSIFDQYCTTHQYLQFKLEGEEWRQIDYLLCITENAIVYERPGQEQASALWFEGQGKRPAAAGLHLC
jgi:hypothetical protein